MSRFSEVGVFPYSINEQGDLVILFRRNYKGPSPELLQDFGWKININEPTVYFSAIRGFISKSYGLFSSQAFDVNIDPSFVDTQKDQTLNGIGSALVPSFSHIEEQSFTEDNIYQWYQSGLQELLYYTKYLVIHYICDEYLGIFIPLSSFTNLDPINKCLSESKGYQGIEFQWLKLDDFIWEMTDSRVEFNQDFVRPSTLVSSFDYSVVWANAIKLLEVQIKALPQEENEEQYDDEELLMRPQPNYGIILLEAKEYWLGLYESMILPNFLDEGDFWELYHGFDGEYPSNDEIDNLNGIIVINGSGINSADQQSIFDSCKLFINIIIEEVNPKREKEHK